MSAISHGRNRAEPSRRSGMSRLPRAIIAALARRGRTASPPSSRCSRGWPAASTSASLWVASTSVVPSRFISSKSRISRSRHRVVDIAGGLVGEQQAGAGRSPRGRWRCAAAGRPTGSPAAPPAGRRARPSPSSSVTCVAIALLRRRRRRAAAAPHCRTPTDARSAGNPGTRRRSGGASAAASRRFSRDMSWPNSEIRPRVGRSAR